MPLSHFSKLFAVEDAKLNKITADPAGGATTLGTTIDVPGIKECTVSGSIDVKSLRGDNVELDTNSVLSNVLLTVTHAKIHLDILSILMGGTVTDAGVTPNQTAKWALGTTPVFSAFQFQARTPADGADFVGGAARLTVYKARLASFPDLGFAEEDYRTISFQARCVARLSDGKQIDELFEETATALT